MNWTGVLNNKRFRPTKRDTIGDYFLGNFLGIKILYGNEELQRKINSL